MKNVIKKIFAISVIVLWVFMFVAFTGCQSTEAARVESLVESRLDAERARLRVEFSQELHGIFISELELIQQSVERGTTALERLRLELEGYRGLFISTIDRLQRIESEGTAPAEAVD